MKWEKRQAIEKRAKELENKILIDKSVQSTKSPLTVKKGEATKRITYASEKMTVSMTVKPKLVVPFEIWRDHLIMSKFAKGEYTTCMKLTNEKDSGIFRISDYFLPTQECTGASAVWTRDGVIELVKYTGGDIEHWYGVFHIHPWVGNTVSMSGTDVNAMWNWVGASKRGVFLVSNPSGAHEAWLVLEANGIKMQIPMEFEIDYSVNAEKTEALKASLLAKVKDPYVAPLSKGFGKIPYNKPYSPYGQYSMEGYWEGDDKLLEAQDKQYEYDPDLYWKNLVGEVSKPYVPKGNLAKKDDPKVVVENEDDYNRNRDW